MTRRFRATPELRRLTGWLVDHVGSDVAFVLFEGGVWLAHGSPHTGAPWSPVVDLVQGVRASVPNADRVLRGRIFASYALDEAETALVNMAAQRVCVVRCEAGGGSPGAIVDVGAAARAERQRIAEHGFVASRHLPEDGLSEQDYLRYANSLGRELVHHEGPTHRRNRPIGAVAVDAAGRVLCAARNTSGVNRVAHAEVSLVQGWWLSHGRPLPAGTTVYVSWTPCRMCASWLVRMTEPPGLSAVVYATHDPGSAARDTAIARRGLGRLAAPTS